MWKYVLGNEIISSTVWNGVPSAHKMVQDPAKKSKRRKVPSAGLGLRSAAELGQLLSDRHVDDAPNLESELHSLRTRLEKLLTTCKNLVKMIARYQLLEVDNLLPWGGKPVSNWWESERRWTFWSIDRNIKSLGWR